MTKPQSRVVSDIISRLVLYPLQVEEATVVMEDDSPVEAASVPGSLRNLSAWSTTIPQIHSYDDELKREKIHVFCINVERNDRKDGEHAGT